MDNFWEELQTAPTRDRILVRRAYARRLKLVHPEDDPEGFQRLRAAYEQALEWLTYEESCSDEGDELSKAEPNQSRADPLTRATQAVVVQQIQPECSVKFPPIRAEDLVAELKSIAESQGDQAAVEKLQRMLDSPELHNIELKEQFKALLIELLLGMRPVPPRLLEEVAVLTEVEARSRLVRSGLTAEALELLERLKIKRVYLRLLAAAHAGAVPHTLRPGQVLDFDAVPASKIFAAKVLTGSFDPVYFRKIARYGRKRQMVLELLARLNAESPGVLVYELDPRVTEWWRLQPAGAPNQPRKIAFWTKTTLTAAIAGCVLGNVLEALIEGFSGHTMDPRHRELLAPTATLTTPALVVGFVLFLKKTAVGKSISRRCRARTARIVTEVMSRLASLVHRLLLLKRTPVVRVLSKGWKRYRSWIVRLATRSPLLAAALFGPLAIALIAWADLSSSIVPALMLLAQLAEVVIVYSRALRSR